MARLSKDAAPMFDHTRAVALRGSALRASRLSLMVNVQRSWPHHLLACERKTAQPTPCWSLSWCGRGRARLFSLPQTRGWARRAGAAEEEKPHLSARRAAFPAFAFHGARTRAGP